MTEDDEEFVSLGAWVRRRRRALDLTQAALADRAGCAEITIRKIETNTMRPSSMMAQRLARYLDLPLDARAVLIQVACGERSVTSLPSPLVGLAPSTPARAVQPPVGVHLPVDILPSPAPLPYGSRMPLSRNPLFVGRDADLRELAQALHTGATAVIGQIEIAVATGMGGIGKTQLACEFVHRYGQYFPGGVFWLSFADPAAVPAEVAACGGGEGMHLSAEFGMLPLDEQVQHVLTAWERPLPRLLVFDNCEDEALLDQWRPKHGGCRVLVTSRRHHWAPALGVQAVPLDVLPRVESITLLRTFRPDLPVADSDLQAIAATLGDLPLALHLAGSFLAKYRHTMTPAQYLRRLQAPTLLDDRSLQAAGLSPTRHVQHVARTFEQSYTRLDPADPTDALARTLLAHAACFAPGEPLPRPLLLQTLVLTEGDTEGMLLAEDALTRLIDLGLLETDALGNLRLHRLVAAFVAAVLVDATAQATVEATMLRVADNLNKRRNVRPFVEPHLRFIVEAAQGRADARTAGLCHALGVYLWLLGVYREAQRYLEQALAIRQQVLGPDHLDTAWSLHYLGNVLYGQGQYAEAQRSYEQALAIRQQVLGANHPDTAHCLNNLGEVFRLRQQYAEAQGYYEQALAIYQRVLRADHSYTAASLNNLGEMFRLRQQYAEAQGYYEQALAIYQRVLEADHPDIAHCLSNLGLVLAAQGQYAEAQDCHEHALAICQRVLGPDHPETARSLRGLGEVFHAQGETAQARYYLERALGIFEQRLGPQHPDTEQTRQTIVSLDAARTVGDQEQEP